MERRSKDESTSRRGKRRVIRRYHVALTPKQVLDRLAELPGVTRLDRQTMPDMSGAGLLVSGMLASSLVGHTDYTLEHDQHEFTLHCGSGAARGQSATGMLRILYLRGIMTRTDEGTLIELSFAHRRPRWALHRLLGFLAIASLGLLWVLIGPGELSTKAALYGVLLLVLGPVVVHDLRGGQPLEQRRKELLNLVERSFGPIQLDEPHPDEPYRRRMVASTSEPRDVQRETDEDDEQD